MLQDSQDLQYSHTAFESAQQKGEQVTRIFRNTAACNPLDITAEIARIQRRVCVLQGAKAPLAGAGQAEIIYTYNLIMEAPDAFFGYTWRFLARYN